jgi:hypothetical protein
MRLKDLTLKELCVPRLPALADGPKGECAGNRRQVPPDALPPLGFVPNPHHQGSLLTELPTWAAWTCRPSRTLCRGKLGNAHSFSSSHAALLSTKHLEPVVHRAEKTGWGAEEK